MIKKGGGIYTPEEAPNGVYIVSTNGLVYKRSKWDTNNNDQAVGVGVKTENCSFVIAPEEQNSIKWGDKGPMIEDCVDAYGEENAMIDYKGKQNTDAIIAYYGTSDNYAALYCRNYIFKNGKAGYLPASGEIWEALKNKLEVDNCLSIIGGTKMYDSSIKNYTKLSSTQYISIYIWHIGWWASNLSYDTKYEIKETLSARPFTDFR